MEELIFELRVERLKSEKLRREWNARRAIHEQEVEELRTTYQDAMTRERFAGYEEGVAEGRALGYTEAEEKHRGKIEELEKQISQLCELQLEKEGLCDELQ